MSDEKSINKVTVVARADPCLFTAFALLNATGYNAENGWQFSEVRKAVRLKLACRGDYWRSALSDAALLEPMQRAGGAMLMDIVPLLSPPRSFILQVDGAEYTTSWQRESKSSLAGIDQWLRCFYAEEALDLLWSEHLCAYEEAVNLLQRLRYSLLTLVAQFGENSKADTLDIVLMPNLLDAKGRGYSLSTPQRTWLFIGPVDGPSQAEELAIHELLHRWVDVVAERTVGNNRGPDLMPLAKAQFRIVAECYPDLAIWVGETVVRATTAWLMQKLRHPSHQSKNELVYYEQIGLIGIQDAYCKLVGETERSLIDAIQEAVEFVYHRVLTECSVMG